MIIRVKKQERGVTFVEMMVALFIFTLVAGGLYATLMVGNISWQNFEAAVQVQQDVRHVVMSTSRDFRTAQNIAINTSEAGVIITFHHPKDGTVRYSWLTQGTDALTVFRHSKNNSRRIGKNISELTVLDSPQVVTMTVTAQARSRQGKEIVFSLKHQVAKRI